MIFLRRRKINVQKPGKIQPTSNAYNTYSGRVVNNDVIHVKNDVDKDNRKIERKNNKRIIGRYRKVRRKMPILVPHRECMLT